MSFKKNICIIDSIYERHFSAPTVEQSIIKDGEIQLFHIKSSEDFASLPLEAIDVMLVWACVPSIAVNEKILSRLSRCKAIVKVAVGYDNIELKTAREFGIPVYNIPDYGTEEVADHSMALLLSMIRKIAYMDKISKNDAWDWSKIKPAHRIRGRKMGIIGFGRIGGAVAKRAQAFGIDVVFYDPYVQSGIEKTFGVRRADTLIELLESVDYISIHASLTETSHHLIGPKEFERIKKGALIVNTARGSIIDKTSLTHALEAGTIAMAGLDVIEGEPFVSDNLKVASNIILTAHSAFYSEEAFQEMREKSARMANLILAGTPSRNLLN
ncbi:MAG: C-terminal binding protein [Acidovorax sp.]|uniref:C-terminal binding protein n=1 Tax=Acidovorax sp. TaxID=1872122 RepID=UPI0039E5DD10